MFPVVKLPLLTHDFPVPDEFNLDHLFFLGRFARSELICIIGRTCMMKLHSLAVALSTTFAFLFPLQGICQVAPVRADAIDFPSKHAWDLFLLLNHPAIDPKLGTRGVPDLAKKIGDPGEVVWETWRAATPEVYTVDGSRPPADYNDLSLANSCPSGKVPEPPTKMGLLHPKGQIKPQFNPGEGIDLTGLGGFGETRMNKSSYNFILANNLYNLEGQKAYASKLVAAGPTSTFISFPQDAIEVKAAWIEFTTADITAGLQQKYYTVDWAGRKFGLQTLHISTKDLPNWFWATFHHKNEIGHVFDGAKEKKDLFGAPDTIKGTVWENYVLGGTQTDFTDSIGRPDFLSDAYVEAGFKVSSCITCHSRASRLPSGNTLSGTDPAVGTPIPTKQPALFVDPKGQLRAAPIDFVWSTIRAKASNPNAKLADPCANNK